MLFINASCFVAHSPSPKQAKADTNSTAATTQGEQGGCVRSKGWARVAGMEKYVLFYTGVRRSTEARSVFISGLAATWTCLTALHQRSLTGEGLGRPNSFGIDGYFKDVYFVPSSTAPKT